MSQQSIFNPKYVISELRENAPDEEWWRDRVQQRINSPIQGEIKPREDALHILEEQWSTLIILDACRADLFESTNEAGAIGKPDITQSVGSSTPEWLQRTFGSSHGDIVYVSGNPMVTRHKSSSFHSLIEAWKGGYDPEESVVRPEAVTEAALDAREQFPNKRLIVHYMQPHYPFVGHSELNYADYEFEDVGLDSAKESQGSVGSVWTALERGMVDKESVWEGYKDNLRVVIPEVKKLISKIDDDLIITSDHGNSLGERSWPIPLRTYGHPDNLRLSSLIDVPLIQIDGVSRNIKDDGTNPVNHDSEKLRDRLADLGYLQ
ncbi:hypothetical protein [Halorubrum sp. T3]|uniref:hypothetical protein n=1 Tax=Halorubrum sp. T3 TaxID=1194088 RepID=UPI0012BAC393|nr:hypothetical protein [Halorubrum sp. T3]